MKKIFTTLTILFILTNSFAQNEFLNELKNNNSNSKQTVLIFYKPDCPYCVQMETLIKDNVTFQKQIIENYAIQLVNISTDKGKQIALKYNITGVPTLIKLNPDSINEEKLKGFGSITRVSTFLKLNLAQNSPTNLKNILATCGDGNLEAGEQCDDGNFVSGDGCDNNCTTTTCGNGIVTTGETCDDGNLTNGDGCNNTCQLEAICGNGSEEAGEQCDDGNLNDADGCDSNCTITSCGNGIVTFGETCDDGNFVSGDGCDNNCTTTTCGNGIVTTGETCDDGNLTNGDGCNNTCQLEAICGNGTVEAGETCDDGNLANNDGCNNICQLEINFNSTTGPFPDNSCTPANEFTFLVSGIGVLGTNNKFDQIAININHTFDADLDISLIAPNGTTIDLSSDNGSSGDNFTNTLFRADASTLITAGTAPFTGSFLPEGNLSTLTGINADGTWILRVCDDANTDTGSLNNATLTFASIVLAINTFNSSVFNVYPNPVKDIINLSSDNNISNIKVYNLIGQEVITKLINSNQSQIDMSNLTSGTYILKISSDNEIKTIKIIKQ